MEFSGSTIAALDMAGRMTVANMVVEAGAKVGLMAVDRTTEDYECGRAERPWKAVTADEGASYERELHVNVESMAPLVACPSLPSNVRAASELADVNLDQVVIGSCTNGRIEDLREAAFVMCGKQVAPHVRCIVLPATQGVYRQALDEGSWPRSWTRAVRFPPQPAAHVWVGTWAFWRRGSMRWQPPTATSVGVWDIRPHRCIWQVRQRPLRRRSWGGLACRPRLG